MFSHQQQQQQQRKRSRNNEALLRSNENVHIIPMDEESSVSAHAAPMKKASCAVNMDCNDGRKSLSNTRNASSDNGCYDNTTDANNSKSGVPESLKDSTSGAAILSAPLSTAVFSPQLALLQDALSALHDVKVLTKTVGSSVVMQEAIAVNKRVLEAEHRISKRMKYTAANNRTINHEADEEESTDGEDYDDGHEQPEHMSASNSLSVQERASILRQACRMKRMTSAFRDIQKLQSILIREIQDCMLDEAVASSAAAAAALEPAL